MPGEATITLTLAPNSGQAKPFPFVLKKVMDIPPPNILEGDDEIKKEKLCLIEATESGGDATSGGGSTTARGGGGGSGGPGAGAGGVSASLTPAIWEKTIPYDGENFHLEYMDLDEFLLENGIPISLEEELQKSSSLAQEQSAESGEEEEAADNAGGRVVVVATAKATALSTSAAAAAAVASTTTQQVPEVLLPSPKDSLVPELAVELPQTLEEKKKNKKEEQKTAKKRKIEEVQEEEEEEEEEEDDDEEEYDEDDDDAESLTDASELRPVKARAEGKVTKDRVTPTPMDPEEIEVDINYQPDPTDLVLSSVPGGELFNPRKHRFSEDELKPQPMIKKAKKVFVPNDAKDDKYWSRRKKNNMAAKRSRDARRLKENQIAVRASFLERENAALRQEVAELRKDYTRCKSVLSRYEAKYGPL
ncbi:TEF transcription factor, PAR bZIP family member b [Engraulis encrasicolus]|uniref:TEF transcription factor, PAR bZIP family member b n=1 Tax=Engraulis encrasicolus TaxID=184585 RepID=UPI002FD322EA